MEWADVSHHYVIVRDDLERGPLGAQITHAAGESARLQAPGLGTRAIVLQASGESLLQLEQALAEAGILHAAVREPDPPFDNALVAIGVAPTSKTRVKRFLSNLPLLR